MGQISDASRCFPWEAHDRRVVQDVPVYVPVHPSSSVGKRQDVVQRVPSGIFWRGTLLAAPDLLHSAV